jgi:hypothetical protein
MSSDVSFLTGRVWRTNQRADREDQAFCYACSSFTSIRMGLYSVLRSPIHGLFSARPWILRFFGSPHNVVFLTCTEMFCFLSQGPSLRFSLLEHRVSRFLRNVGINRVYAYKTWRNLKHIFIMTIHLYIATIILSNAQKLSHILFVICLSLTLSKKKERPF